MMIHVHTPPRAADLDASLEGVVARDLVNLTMVLDRLGYQAAGAGLGGRFGYGAHFANEVFRMRPDCGGCGSMSCEDCSREEGDLKKRPNFSFYGDGFGQTYDVRWYKWIGRSMEVEPADLMVHEWRDAMAKVLRSLGPIPAPQRIQQRRTRDWRMPRHARGVGRASAFGNPYRPNASTTRAECVDLFRRDLMLGKLPFTEADVLAHLRGWDLACWCPLPAAGEPDICHAAVLLEVANRG